MPGNDDKTEKASPHKRMQERKKGNVFQSRDLVSAVMILLSFLSLRFLAGFMLSRFYSVLIEFINMGKLTEPITIPNVSKLLMTVIYNIFLLAMPILLIALILGIVLSVAQTRFVFTSDVLKPKLDRINPINGFKKMFSIKSLVELAKSLLKIVIIIIIVYNVIRDKLYELPMLMNTDINASVKWLGESIFTVALYGGIGMAGIGIVDYFYQWWEHERSLKMSKQEIKDEYKQLEGDPQVKGRIKSIQNQMAQNRMMSGVKDADVVIRNPQHYAIALKYNIGENVAPLVIAKGIDYVALRIVREAELNNVQTIENPPLARALYSMVEIGDEIPEEFYQAVADILGYVYDLKKVKIDVNALGNKQ